MLHLSITILKLQDIFIYILNKTIANTDSSHEITESIGQYTELTSDCNA